MWVAIIILILQVIALAAAAYSGKAKLKKLMDEAKNETNNDIPNANGLSEIDQSILNLLKERQGVIYQSEIIKELGLPKSTVHKALRRLSEAGYVEIQKRGRYNIVILKFRKSTTSEASTI
ncbi:MAG: winged helix-turn-helix transcriptional regulator [Pyrobaculum sp.]